MKATPSRILAARVTERVATDGAWAPGVLDAELKRAALDRRDASFATRLAYGAVELMPTLDAAIRERADRPGRIKPRVMAALRVAAYEILMLDTPTAIAVDQGVALVKERDPHAGGFANAVLRRLAGDAAEFPWGDPDTDIRAAARLAGIGTVLTDRLVADLGEDASRAFMRGSTGAPPMYLAANPFKTTDEQLRRDLDSAGSPAEECEPVGCLKCSEPAAVLTSAVLDDGRAIVADRTAQVVAALVPLSSGARVLDIASGRGNKTALMAFVARRANTEIGVAAVDLHEWKCQVLSQRMALLGIHGVTAYALDATDAVALEEGVGRDWDAVLIDAPCSNLGTLRRHPEVRWRFESDAPDRLAALGSSLLMGVARLVRPGGFVVYSTCTVLPAENEAVIAGFLGTDAGGGFQPVDLRDRVPADLAKYVTGEGYFRSMPEPDGPDGHFAALLQRAD